MKIYGLKDLVLLNVFLLWSAPVTPLYQRDYNQLTWAQFAVTQYTSLHSILPRHTFLPLTPGMCPRCSHGTTETHLPLHPLQPAHQRHEGGASRVAHACLCQAVSLEESSGPSTVTAVLQVGREASEEDVLILMPTYTKCIPFHQILPISYFIVSSAWLTHTNKILVEKGVTY